MDRISVVVPFKNEEKFLSDCIQSMVEQLTSHFTFEIILVDDHSTDTSAEIANSFVVLHENISLCKNQGQGITEALLTGLSHATGNFISRMDADDIMPNDKLLNLYSTLISMSEAHLSTGFVKYFATGKELSQGYMQYQDWLNSLVKNDTHFKEIYKECPIASPNWLIRKEHFESLGGFHCDYPEDYELVFKWKKAEFIIANCPKITHLWRDHPHRVSRNSEVYSDNSFIRTKVNGFIACDYIDSKSVALVGAGKKGKKIALALKEKKISFKWLTSNPNKIGHVIYDKKLEDLSILQNIENHLIIIGFSNPKDLEEMKNNSEKDDLNSYFWFF